MSDYLSTLAARSLRREPACEPRRAQMFEPRQETPDAGIAEAVYEGLPNAETFEGVAPDPGAEAHARPSHTPPPPRAVSEDIGPDFHASPRHADAQETPRPSPPTALVTTPHDTLQIPDTLQTAHPRTSEDAPAVRETMTPRVARLAQPSAVLNEPRPYEPEPHPTAVTETKAAGEPKAADEPPAAHTPRDVSVSLRTPPLSPPNVEDVRAERVSDSPRPFVPTRRSSSRAASQTPPHAHADSLSPNSEPEHIIAPAADDSGHALNQPPLTGDVKTSSPSTLRPTYVSLKPGDSPTHEGQGRATAEERTAAFDEEARELTPPSVRRVTVEPSAAVESRAGVPALTGSTTVVELEVVPQPNTPKPPDAPKLTQTAETSARSNFETLPGGVLEPRPFTASTRVSPVAAQPTASNARPSLSPPTVAQTGTARGAVPGGVGTTGREGVAQSTPPPTIEVTIGRIDVRAVAPPAAPPPPPRERHEPPKMSLDEYLRAQGGGRR